jgi:hypothetical protein
MFKYLRNQSGEAVLIVMTIGMLMALAMSTAQTKELMQEIRDNEAAVHARK